MPHIAFLALTGARVVRPELIELGMTLPGIQQRASAITSLPALGPLTLAGMTPERFTCSFHESSGRTEDELLESISRHDPILVVVSALTASALDAYRLGERFRERNRRTVFGGLHASTCPDESSQHFDAVVVGDGESVWPDILFDTENGALRPNYRSNGGFDLADAPIPRWDLIRDGSRPRFTLQTQRGCPLACEFCAASRLLGRFREKPVANIRRELAAIRAIDPKPVIELADDNTFAGGRNPDELFDVLADANARWFTEADWRIGTRPDVLRRLAQSGCVQVLVGIESFVEDYRGMGAKKADRRRILDALDAVQDAGVAVIGCFVVGADGETRGSIDDLGRFLEDCSLADVQLTLQTPFPGTALRSRLEREGRLLHDRGWDHYTLFDVTYRPDRMSVAELESSFSELAKWTYRAEATRRRMKIRKRVWKKNPHVRRLASLRWHDSSSATAKRS